MGKAKKVKNIDWTDHWPMWSRILALDGDIKFPSAAFPILVFGNKMYIGEHDI